MVTERSGGKLTYHFEASLFELHTGELDYHSAGGVFYSRIQ